MVSAAARVVVASSAAGGDRTHDLRIKSPLLCQLSYGGALTMIAHPAGAVIVGTAPTYNQHARPHGLVV